MTIKTILFKTQIIVGLSVAVLNFAQNTNINYDKDFKLNRNYFPVDNNFAKAAVETKDGYLIAGQNFVEEDNTQHNSAIIKIDKTGKLIKKTTLGENKDYRKESFMKTVYSINNNRLIQLGSKKIDDRAYLWLREINDNLDVLQDTLFESISASVTQEPMVFNVKDGFYVISESGFYRDLELNITFISNDLQKVDNHVISYIEPPFDFFNKYDFSASLANNKLYVTTNGVDERDKENIYATKYKTYILEYDLSTHKITKHKKVSEADFLSRKVIVHKDLIYLIGIKDTGEPMSNKNTRRNTVVKVLNMNFEKVKEFNYVPAPDKGKFNEHLYDAVIVNDELHIVGEMYKSGTFSNESVYLKFDLNGKLLDDRLLKYGSMYSENRMIKIVPLKNNDMMLLGKGEGWRVIIK
ncbi:hypothetical protein OF897_13465 [Chryseobacterium formosus]|uniref:Uncharacterized protein n=1 Tax=Chryseobacterium formosus TaxID=1537363 RepID=A0ABT3XTP8_9FLAO|nr:hypothetical protein [Chryseobacterium formosus]MCX8524922.1 hypothetical protein [Chryseobacterium formosus]